MQCRILVVDDDAMARRGLEAYLRGRGYLVDCAAGSAEAIALLSAARYAAVITDLQLTPARGAEGLAVVVEVRRRSPNTRTVLFTGQSSPDVEAATRLIGTDAFFHKATPLLELERALRALVKDEE